MRRARVSTSALLHLVALTSLGACLVGEQLTTEPDPTDPDPTDPDPDDPMDPDPIEPDPTSRVCTLPETAVDAPPSTALAAQQCNVPGSQGAQKWYRLATALPSGAMDLVQVELWPGRGTFATAPIASGSYTLTAADAAFATCGIYIRGLGDKGTTDAKEYLATSGSVQITLGAAGQPIAAVISNAELVQVDPRPTCR